jgi:hypothetical protein
MIAEIDNALRDLFFHEIPLRKGEVEIDFDQPKREWSSRLNKPTLNLYLFDLRENIDLRGSEQWSRKDLEDGTIALHRNPVRIDLLYLITSWAKEVVDEHQLLSQTLVMLLRQPILPDMYLPESMKNPSVPIWMETAQNNLLANPSSLWNTLDNDLRPGIRLKVTISIDPYGPIIVPAVSTTEIGFMQNPSSDTAKDSVGQRSSTASASRSYFAVRGKITSQKYSTTALTLVLAESGKNIELNENGEFAIGRLESGEYHLDVTANGRVLKRQKLVVPSPKYEFEI